MKVLTTIALTTAIMSGAAYADNPTCMTSDAVVFVNGQENVMQSSGLKNQGVKNGMFKVKFDDPKYTILQHDENAWVGYMNKNGMNVIATMDFNTMTYTKQLSSTKGEDTAVMLIVNKCM